jgi:hypothetical protein
MEVRLEVLHVHPIDIANGSFGFLDDLHAHEWKFSRPNENASVEWKFSNITATPERLEVLGYILVKEIHYAGI